MIKKFALALVAVALTLSLAAPTAQAASKIKITQAPVIAAQIAGGQTISATPAKFSAKVKSGYKWLLDGAAIKGATKLHLSVTTEMVGHDLQFVHTGKPAKGNAVAAKSNTVRVGVMQISGTPVVSYTDASQKQLSVALPTVLNPTTATVKYQWFRGGMDIEGQTLPTFELGTVDRGKQISVVVTFEDPNYQATSVDSNVLDIPALLRTYNLIWSDEFNGSGAPDASVWTAQEGDGVAFRNKGWGNKERQWYLLDKANQTGSGSLEIEATKTGAANYQCYYGTCEWVSSKLVTLDKVGFMYGRLEAKMKAAPGAGTWAAFWTLGSNIAKRGWPGCGELDVVELLGKDPFTTLGYSHGPVSVGGGRGDRLTQAEDLTKGYHTYAIDWLPDQITWYLDGQKYAEVNKTDNDWVYDHEMYLILNLAMGGNLGGGIDANLNSSTLSFDYVRVYSINGIGEVIKH